jgi:putative membrane protein
MFTVKSNRINMDALLRLVILLGFALFFYSIIQTGKVQLYVNPRIVPYVKFGIVVMAVISLFSIRDIFKPKRKVNLTLYLFFLIPLLMAFSLPAKSMDSTSMAFGDVKITQQQSGNTDYLTPEDAADPAEGTDQVSDNSSETADNSQSSDSPDSTQADPDQEDSDQSDNGLVMQGDTIVMGDDNFVQWLQEIYDNMGRYEGKKIEVTGFVFKSKDFKADEFAPARLMMACCTADLQPIGLLCRYDKASELKHDTWLKVTGTIKIVDYKGEKTPVIIAGSIVSADKPKNEYVYPY